MFDINATFIAELLGFLLLLGFIRTYIIPTISGNLAARRTYIKDKLAQLAKADQVMLDAEVNSISVTQEAEDEARRILTLAELGSKEIRKKALADIEEEIEAIKRKINANAESIIKNERLKLREEVKHKSIIVAEQILRCSVNAEQHEKLVEEMIERL